MNNLSRVYLCLFLMPFTTLFLKAQSQYIQILGIAQDGGYPQSACKKSCCQAFYEGKTKKLMVASLAIVDTLNGKSWIIDATPDFPAQIKMVDAKSPLAGIFLSHAHIGHYTGLMYLGREVMGYQNMPVYTMPRMKTFLESNGPWSQLVQLKNIQLMPLEDSQPVYLSSRLSVTPLKVPHRDEFSETVGFLIYGNEKKLLYIPDIDKWNKWNTDIRDLIRTVDYALLDGSFYSDGEIPGRDMSEIPHPFIEESMSLFASLLPQDKKKIYFIHLNHTNPLIYKPDVQKEVKARGFGLAKQGMKLSL